MPADDLNPGLGTTVSVCATLPATETETAYEALTWLPIGEITEVPEFGPEFDVVSHVPLATGVTTKYHGAKNNGSMNLPMALDRTDTGQTALKTAMNAKARVAFKVQFADLSANYFQGKVFSFRRGASIGSVVTAGVMVEVETNVLEVATP